MMISVYRQLDCLNAQRLLPCFFFFFFNDTATTEIYTLSLHDALPISLAVELAPIRVNAVSPGVVRTNLWQTMSASERERLYESVGKSLPVGRVGEAHDIAQAYLFLMKEGFSTGQTVVVDGGTVLV